MNFKLKKDMLLGAATAATQIEGGDTGSNWNDWFRRGHIKDGSDPTRADDHYLRWKEDADLLSEMGLQVYRMSIEWARICPAEDRIDRQVIQHYREEILYLKEKGIQVLLTIHHFTNPMWFEAKGGFTKAENIPDYLSFVETVVSSFGDIVSEYITINEPNVYASLSYFFGDFPPGEKSFSKTIRVMSVMAVCHIRAYELIHEMRLKMGLTDTKVSFAHHLRTFVPENPRNPVHRLYTAMMERFFQGAVTKAFFLGKFEWPMKNTCRVKRGKYVDFIAVNYYTRTSVSGLKNDFLENVPKNDLGWEIYPEGIVSSTQKLYDILPRPVYITENGTCDNQDTFRCRYLFDHLKVLSESDLPIKRYYHWCFCDNFEWLEGESARFGLVRINYKTQERTVKKSGEFFSKMIREGGVSEELFDQYVKNQTYHN